MPVEKITTKTPIREVMRIPELRVAAPYFSGGSGFFVRFVMSAVNSEGLHRLAPSAHPQSMVVGMQRLLDVAKMNGKYVYSVYEKDLVHVDRNLADVKLFHFPGNADQPFVLICAGGGFTCVSSFTEAFPIAAKLNELGYTAFVLNYRVGKHNTLDNALCDMASSIQYIFNNKESFGVKADGYAVAGCSAGGLLTVLWGTKQHGYLKYGLPKPEILMPVYPFVTPTLWKDNGHDRLLTRLFGSNYTSKHKHDYDTLLLADSEYPPSYIICCKDDKTVSYQHSESLANTLRLRKVSCVLEMGNHGGHGFGDGRGSDVEGWIDRVVAFWKTHKG